jgi:hypothetical protein
MDWVIVVVVIASSTSEDDRVGVRTIHYLLAPLRRCVSRSIEKGESRDDEVDDEAVAIRIGVGGTVGAVGAVGGARGELRVRLHRGDADV